MRPEAHRAGRSGLGIDQSRRAFILANTEIVTPPHVPQLRLHLATEAFDLWHKTEDELQEIGLPPPYWAFAWAGGQALARFLLDNPDSVRGRTVVDIGTGCGIAAIAAARCGAADVTALDLDPFAITATRLNAALNGVSVTAFNNKSGTLPAVGSGDAPESCIYLIADLFYESGLGLEMNRFAQNASAHGHTVLIGDPMRAYLPKAPHLQELACYEVPVTRALEDAEIRKSRVFRVIAQDTPDSVNAQARPG